MYYLKAGITGTKYYKVNELTDDELKKLAAERFMECMGGVFRNIAIKSIVRVELAEELIYSSDYCLEVSYSYDRNSFESWTSCRICFDIATEEEYIENCLLK